MKRRDLFFLGLLLKTLIFVLIFGHVLKAVSICVAIALIVLTIEDKSEKFYNYMIGNAENPFSKKTWECFYCRTGKFINKKFARCVMCHNKVK